MAGDRGNLAVLQDEQTLADLGPPAWPAAQRRVRPAPPAATESVARSLAGLLAVRFAQLTLLFVAATIVVLAMSLVAQAMR